MGLPGNPPAVFLTVAGQGSGFKRFGRFAGTGELFLVAFRDGAGASPLIPQGSPGKVLPPPTR